jgi:hypothetical protein
MTLVTWMVSVFGGIHKGEGQERSRGGGGLRGLEHPLLLLA